MNNWTEVTKGSPCEICGKPNWCSRDEVRHISICRRVAGGKELQDKSGGTFWLYKDENNNFDYLKTNTKIKTAKRSEPVCADKKILNEVYLLVLDNLELSKKHLNNLVNKRKVPLEQVKKRGYKSLNKAGKDNACKVLLEHYSIDLLLTVPGFYLDSNGSLKMSGCYGLVLPVRRYNGDIIALKVRTDGQGKYLYISSKSKGGPSSGSHIHFPLNDYHDVLALRVTEGELKADITTMFSDIPTISIPGVGTWKKLIPVIKYFKPSVVKVAFDSDFDEKEQVGRSLVGLVSYLERVGVDVELEVWE